MRTAVSAENPLKAESGIDFSLAGIVILVFPAQVSELKQGKYAIDGGEVGNAIDGGEEGKEGNAVDDGDEEGNAMDDGGEEGNAMMDSGEEGNFSDANPDTATENGEDTAIKLASSGRKRAVKANSTPAEAKPEATTLLISIQTVET